MAGFYEQQLLILIFICACIWFLERRMSRLHAVGARHDANSLVHERDLHMGESEPLNASRLERPPSHALIELTRRYLGVYGIVMGADWLQGPYVYSLYREQYAFSERTAATLFLIGFISAGFTAPMVGIWADQYGRKTLCLVFCLTYTLTCILILLPFFPILVLCRFLGGISTSILYSAFEAWLISAAHGAGLAPPDLARLMGQAALVNGCVATGAGVVSNELVNWTGGLRAPFLASAGLLVVAGVAIRTQWTENYGGLAVGGTGSLVGAGVGVGAGRDAVCWIQYKRLVQAWRTVRNDPLLLVIGFTQTCFEGSMYIFVFLWVPFLQETSTSLTDSSLPLGYIFSSFMISMMIGSILYTGICTSFCASFTTPAALPSSPSRIPDERRLGESPLTLHAKLSSLVCALSSVALALSVKYNEERIRFWAFCAFEGCVGMYYPVQGMLRGTLIADEHRATLSALFRVPLNVFVVVSLLSGVSSARYAVLSASSVILAASSLTTAFVLVVRTDELRTSS